MTYVAYGKFFQSQEYFASGTASAAAFVSVCLVLVLYDHTRFWWAGRIVTASIFGSYLWYLLDFWLNPPVPAGNVAPPAGIKWWQPVLGLIIIGWPCLCYTFLGRFTLSRRWPLNDPLVGQLDESGSEHGNTDKNNGPIA